MNGLGDIPARSTTAEETPAPKGVIFQGMELYCSMNSFLLNLSVTVMDVPRVRSQPQPTMSEIINPTLDLFLYHKRDKLGAEENAIQRNRAKFSQNFPKHIPINFHKEATASSREYIRLLDTHHWVDAEVEGYEEYYYAVMLNDAYGLFYSCSVKERLTPQPLSCFQPLKQLAQNRKQYADLGKTWMISGYSAEHEPEAIAQAIYKEAGLSGGWIQHRKGKFLGVPIFEVGNPPKNLKDFEAKDSHFLIIIFPNRELQVQLGGFTRLLLQLFCFRNKIFCAYGKTRQFKEELKESFLETGKTISIIQTISGNSQELSIQQLKKLQVILNENIKNLYDYAHTLSLLEIHLQTIEVNLFNYEKCLSKISEKALAIGDTNLSFLADFSTIVKQTYCQQIEKDYASLSPGLRVLENSIATIRGIVEINRAQLSHRFEEREKERDIWERKRDRHLNIAIAAIGFGVGIGGIVASSSLHLTREANPNIQLPFASGSAHSFFVAVVMSIICGIAAAAIAGWGTKLFLDWSDRDRSKSSNVTYQSDSK